MEVLSKNVEKLEKSQVKVTITVANKSINEEYQKLLKKYSSTFVIKGFRKGKVPTSVLENKFGDAIRQEVAAVIAEEVMGSSLTESNESPLPYCTPVFEGIEEGVDLEKDFVFSSTHDVYPSYDLPDLTPYKTETLRCSIGDKEINEELTRIQQRNSLTLDKEGAAANGDYATFEVWKCDETNSKTGDEPLIKSDYGEVGAKEGFLFGEELTGMSVGDEKCVAKEFPEDYRIEELSGGKHSVLLHVTKIQEKQIPDIDDELAQDVDEKFETLDQLKSDIKSNLEKSVENLTKMFSLESLYKKIFEDHPVILPETMIDMGVSQHLNEIQQQFGGGEQGLSLYFSIVGTTLEEAIEKIKRQITRSFSVDILRTKIAESQGITSSQEDLKAAYEKEAGEEAQPFDALLDSYPEKERTVFIQRELMQLTSKKTEDYILETTPTGESESVSYKELMERLDRSKEA